MYRPHQSGFIPFYVLTIFFLVQYFIQQKRTPQENASSLEIQQSADRHYTQ